jgi:small subunit ribosomal protein S1
LDFVQTNLLESTTMTQTPIENTNRTGRGSNNPTPEWYQQFIDDFDYELPRQGQLLEGRILRIEEDAILVDVGLKRDAIIPNRDLNNVDNEILNQLSTGDEVTVYVVHTPQGDQDLIVSLHKGLEHENWEKAENHLEQENTLELKVVGKNRGGFLLEFETIQGFLPFSQVAELRRTRDPHRTDEIKRQMIGTALPVKVIEVNRKRRRLIFSAIAAQKELEKQRLNELETGEIVHGPVVNIVKFGVFVDLGGVDGLVHISKLDWRHVNHPSEVVKIGDEIDVKVTDVDVEKGRISLDRRALLPSPMENFAEKHHSGETLEGQVTNVVDFGAFVELMDGVEGLVHASEIGYTSTPNPKDVLRVNERVLVRILDIDAEKGRISLSMRQVPLERQLAWSLETAQPKPEPEAPPETIETQPAAKVQSADQAQPAIEEPPADEKSPEAEDQPAATDQPEAKVQSADQAQPVIEEPPADEKSPEAEDQPAATDQPEAKVQSADQAQPVIEEPPADEKSPEAKALPDTETPGEDSKETSSEEKPAQPGTE